MKRQRGRNRKPGGPSGNANSANPNRSWDSQGPENIKVRGNAQTVYERYQQLARDAGASGDRVLAENYLQHAEHYFRVLRALQPQRPVSEIAARELSNQGFDIDFEDETGAQAAAFMAAQQAADRAAGGGDNGNRDNNDGQNAGGQQRESYQNRDNQNRDGQNRDGQSRGEGQQNREWRDRDNNRDRDRSQPRNERDQPRNDQPRNDQGRAEASRDEPRAEGEEGGRRETRRERWERRRDEKYGRGDGEQGERPSFDDQASAGGESAEPQVAPNTALGGTPYEPAADDAAPVADKPRRTRTPRAEAAPVSDAPVSDGGSLPGFLTRSSTPLPKAETPADEAEAPKRRAPRRKVEPTAVED